MISRRFFPLRRILLTYFDCLVFRDPKAPSSSRSEKPITELRGVLISWLMFIINPFLTLFAASASLFSLRRTFSNSICPSSCPKYFHFPFRLIKKLFSSISSSNVLPESSSRGRVPVSYTHLRAHETRHDI